MLGLNISSSFNQAVTIYILIPILLIPQLVLGGIVIKFSKINPDIKDNTDVPMISEMMASRWAYEGLMVSFFKDNEYNKPFFPTHFKKHVADNHFIYLVPELEAKVQYAIEYAHVNLFKHKDKIESDMLVLRNEFANENKLHPQLSFPNVDRLKPGCNLDVLQEASVYLSKLRTFYSDISRQASVEEGNLYSQLEHQYKGNQNLNTFRLANHNRAIERFVKNSDEDKKIIETDGRLVQMVDPIYKEPSETNRILSRAHFFAPYKYLLGMKVDTAVFNIIILWLMTGGLYVLLYFDGLKKIVELGAFKKKKAQPNA
jgi:hypothetical protein